MVRMFHGFSKPQNKFIRDMVYGIQATGDMILTEIAYAVDSETCPPMLEYTSVSMTSILMFLPEARMWSSPP